LLVNLQSTTEFGGTGGGGGGGNLVPPEPALQPAEAYPVCLDPMLSTMGGLNCLHRFHDACIVKWAETESTCPVCRALFIIIHVVGKSDIVVEEAWQSASPIVHAHHRCSNCNVISSGNELVTCRGCGSTMHFLCQVIL
jgi:hypothetical protein